MNTRGKVPKLEKAFKAHFKNGSFSFNFIGAGSLIDLARQQPKHTYELKTKGAPLSVDENSYIAVCKLDDYFQFICDENKKIKKTIFEANVRDYQGDVNVNKEIRASLQTSGEEDFWWLNNGITILANAVNPKGSRALLIEEPEIVNGLQTSNEIYTHFSLPKTMSSDERGVLVRVIVPEDESSRDRIIKATNSQTSIPPSSLRSTDRVHRNIEDFLKTKGLFYDRRKNYYKNLKKPRSKIISIQQMAQALMAILLRRPDAARARPSTLLSKEEEYQKLFNETNPIEIYYAAVYVMQKVDDFLRDNKLPSRLKTNLRFYIAYSSVCELTHNFEPSMLEIIDNVDKHDAKIINAAFNTVNKLYSDLGGDDQLAKGPKLIDALYAHYKDRFMKKKPASASAKKQPKKA